MDLNFSAFPIEFWPDNKQQFNTLSNPCQEVRPTASSSHQMFTSNNLSIIDETGRSGVMAPVIPAANKWLLTKQGGVALSRLQDATRHKVGHEEERQAGG